MSQRLPDDAPATLGDVRRLEALVERQAAEIETLKSSVSAAHKHAADLDIRTIGSMRIGG